MILEVEVSAVGDAAYLIEFVRVAEMEVHRAFGIVRAIMSLDLDLLDIFRLESESGEPAARFGKPVFEIPFPLGFFHEILELHDLELADAEDEIPRGYLIAERLPYLGHTERKTRMERIDDVLEIDEHALSRFGT